MEPAPETQPEPPASKPTEQAVVEVPAEKVREVLDAIPVERRQELERILFQQSVLAKSHRGPLPPPDDMEKYCLLIPNGGDRIMARHEKQSDHRMEIEKTTINAQMSQSNLGQWMGFVLGAVGLGVSGFCIYTGHDAAGATLGGTTLVGLVSVFVAGKTELWRSLLQKRPRTPEDNEADTLEAKRQIKVREKSDPGT